MSDRTSRTTSLWQLIEALQRRLEDAGMDRAVVDVAVSRGVEAWLDVEPPARAARRERGSVGGLVTPVGAKA